MNKPKKVRITPEAANDIWQACLKAVANGYNDKPLGPVETLANNLRDIQALVDESSNDVIGLFVGQGLRKGCQERQQEQCVTASESAKIMRNRFGFETAKSISRQLEALILEELINSLGCKSLCKGQFDRSALDQGDDDLHRIVVFKGKFF